MIEKKKVAKKWSILRLSLTNKNSLGLGDAIIFRFFSRQKKIFVLWKFACGGAHTIGRLDFCGEACTRTYASYASVTFPRWRESV